MTSNNKEEVHYFYEDEVYRIKRNGAVQFGMVVENSEFASSDEEEDLDELLKHGTLRVAWHPNGDEEVVKEKQVGLADRSLMPGDVIRRLIAGKDTQRGYCRDVSVHASVEIVGTQQVVFGVDSKDLVPLEDFTVDVAVCLDSWVGMIKTINSTVALKFTDGSICELSDEVAEDLEDVLDKRDCDCEFKRYDFYPGQVLSGPIKLFETANFTHITDEMKNLKNSVKASKVVKAMVDKISVASLGINWQCRAYSKDSALEDLNDKQPDYLISGPELKRVRMLNVFEPCTLQIGDRNYYTLKPDDVIMMRDEWKKLEKESYLKLTTSKKVNNNKKNNVKNDRIKKRPDEESSDEESEAEEAGESGEASKTKKTSVPSSTLNKKKKLKRSRKNSDRSSSMAALASLVDLKPGDKIIVETMCTKSEATVVWQDGSIEAGISSRELFPIHALDDQEYFPGDFVIRETSNAGGHTDQLITYDPHSYGVIQSVDHSGRTCSVKWFRTYTSGNEPQPLYVGTSEEPVYDLKDHPDFKYRPGSIVIRVANFNDQVASTGGQVLDNYPSGQVLVWWANNTTSACWPQDLYKIGEYDSDDGELWDDDEDFDDDGQSNDSWETESEHSIHIENNGPLSQSHHQVEDEVSLRSKLAANIERARIAMTKLEEIFNDKSNHYNTAAGVGVVIKQLLDVYKNCRCLDKLLNTEFFAEANFEGLLDKVRERSKSSSTQQAVHDQLQRLFSTEDGQQQPPEASSRTVESSDELNQICARLCSLIKAQLVRSHDEVMVRYGGQAANFTADDLEQSPGEDEIDLQDLMTRMADQSLTSLNKSDVTASDLEPLLPIEHNSEAAAAMMSPSGDYGFYKTKGVSNYEISTALYGSPDEKKPEAIVEDIGEFSMAESAPAQHKFKLSVFQPNDPKNFIKFVRKEVKLLRTSLPAGIHVKGFEDRMDLYSVMIMGPERTPYENGVFFFDFQLSADYPKAPPVCHYVSYVSDRLNPNLYEDGKVCVSLLGTWSGKGTETWTPNSNLLQLLVSIQGLILVAEPYFNEAGYERQKGTQQGVENSRMYNEMVVLKLVQSMTRLASNPPEAFKDEVKDHLRGHSKKSMPAGFGRR